MAYAEFHQPHPDLEDKPPMFHDRDGSPVFETPGRDLLLSIIHNNDVAALNSYSNKSSHDEIFLRWGGRRDSAFDVALRDGSLDVLCELIVLYKLMESKSRKRALEKYHDEINDFFLHVPSSILHEACAVGDLELVLELTKRRPRQRRPPKFTLTSRDGNGRTPLLRTAEALGETSDVIAGKRGDETPIVDRKKAQEHRDKIEGFIYLLLDIGCSLSESNIWENGRPGDQPNAKKLVNTGLGAAIPRASCGMISHLIANGADVHARQLWPPKDKYSMDCKKQVTLLHIASIFWNLEGIRALIDYRGDVELADMVSTPDLDGRLPLHLAVVGSKDRQYEKEVTYESISWLLQTVKTLLDANPETVNARDKDGATVFHYAITTYIGHVGIVPIIRALLARNPSTETLNSRNKWGQTALGLLTQHFRYRDSMAKYTDAVLALLKSGADAYSCNRFGHNILHQLCIHTLRGCITPAIVDHLLRFVGINETDNYGQTPLHLLLKDWNTADHDTVRILISRGADPSKGDEKGNTPLHAFVKGQLRKNQFERSNEELGTTSWEFGRQEKTKQDELIQILLDAGASMDTPNMLGQKPKNRLDDPYHEIVGGDGFHGLDLFP